MRKDRGFEDCIVLELFSSRPVFIKEHFKQHKRL